MVDSHYISNVGDWKRAESCLQDKSLAPDYMTLGLASVISLNVHPHSASMVI